MGRGAAREHAPSQSTRRCPVPYPCCRTARASDHRAQVWRHRRLVHPFSYGCVGDRGDESNNRKWKLPTNRGVPVHKAGADPLFVNYTPEFTLFRILNRGPKHPQRVVCRTPFSSRKRRDAITYAQYGGSPPCTGVDGPHRTRLPGHARHRRLRAVHLPARRRLPVLRVRVKNVSPPYFVTSLGPMMSGARAYIRVFWEAYGCDQQNGHRVQNELCVRDADFYTGGRGRDGARHTFC